MTILSARSTTLLLATLLRTHDCGASSPLVLTNARIYVMADDQDSSNITWAQAIWIDADTGLIESVGTNEDVLAHQSSSAGGGGADPKIVDMEGRLVLPGFQDARLHAVEAGLNENLCGFDTDAPIDEYKYYFEEDAEFCVSGGEFGDQGWLMGAGVDIGVLQRTLRDNPDQDYPITVLDRDFPDTPVVILDSFGHGAVANTAAMIEVGYDRYAGTTDNPPGGFIDRDEWGDLTGIVKENAQQPLRDAAFPPTEANEELAYEGLLEAIATLNAFGITSVSDAGGFWRQSQTESWARAESEGKMTLRASNALYIYPDQTLEEQLPDLLQRYSNDPDKLVRFNMAKIYVDGILSLSTGALYEPYEQSLQLSTEDAYGFEYFGDRLPQVAQTLAEEGFQLHFHVTGDRGAGLALDAIRDIVLESPSAQAGNGPHRITHLYLVDEQDRTRFAEQNVIADFQAAPSSMTQQYRNTMTNALGSTRAQQLIPLAELIDAGATVTLSSDWDADELSPLVKIQTVLTRFDGRNLKNVAEVIPLMTKNVAKLLNTNTGTLQEGKLADLIVLDQDIFSIPVNQISEAKVLATIFNGGVVYDPNGIFGSAVGRVPPDRTHDSSSASLARSGSSLWSSLFAAAVLIAVASVDW